MILVEASTAKSCSVDYCRKPDRCCEIRFSLAISKRDADQGCLAVCRTVIRSGGQTTALDASALKDSELSSLYEDCEGLLV